MVGLLPRPRGQTASYRPEIDGLRAVAVIPVLLFHAEVPGFQGGFVGVDVFFVISGYLITGQIMQDLAACRFNLWSFWSRRLRRIMPLLLLVTFCSLPPVWILMSPDGLQNFGQSVVATVLSANNILLYMTTGYWEIEVGFKPLIHTWSLGVEGQFYLVFPLLALLLWRLPSVMIFGITGIVVVASLFLADSWAQINPDAAFYLLPARFWELGAGSLTAMWLNRAKIPGTADCDLRYLSIMAWIGLTMITASVLTFSIETPHPSFMTLLPTGGAVLFIVCASPDQTIGRLLATPLFVGLGLLSYGIYLWHQPLLAFGRLTSPEALSPAILAGLALLSVPLSWLSFHLVEQPCRNWRRLGLTSFLTAVTTASVALVVLGYLLHAHGGMPARFFSQRSDEMTGAAFADYNDAVRRQQSDAFPTGANKTLLVIGNSYARDFVNMVTETKLFDGFAVIYREDMGDCLAATVVPGSTQDSLMRSATVIVFGSPAPGNICPEQDLSLLQEIRSTRVYYLGNKQFGYNPDAFLRLPESLRPQVRIAPLPEARKTNANLRATIPEGHYVDLFALVEDNLGNIPIFNEVGLSLAGDRSHLTRPGAEFFGRHLMKSGLFDVKEKTE